MAKLKNLDNLPAVFQQDANLPAENNLGLMPLQDLGGFLPTFGFAWGIQAMSKTNYFYISQGGPDEDESNVTWLDKPFRVTVLLAKDVMRSVIENLDGSVSYESAYTKGESEPLFRSLLDTFKDTKSPDLQQGVAYCLAVLVDGQVSLAEFTATKTLYKATYNSLTNALFRNGDALDFAAACCKPILTKSKKGNLFPERARFENHVTRVKITPDEAKAIADASKANETFLENWYKK